MAVERERPAAAWGYAALFALFSALYLLTATRDYAFDSVSYALQIRRFEESGGARWLLHPHHLLFNVLGLAAHRLLGLLWPAADPLAALQVLNALLGAAGVVLFALVAGLIVADRGAGVLAAGGLGLSYGYWTCATDGRANLPGLVALVGALGVIAALLDARRVRRARAFARLAAALGGLHALALLLHQSHVLFLPAAAAAVALSPGRPRRRGVRLYLGISIGLGGLAYAVGALLAAEGRGLGAVSGWALTYARQGRWWDFHVATNLVRDAQAFSHALIADPALSRTPGVGILRLLAGCAAMAGAAAAGARLWRLFHPPRPVFVPSLWGFEPDPHASPEPSLRVRALQGAQRRLLPVLALWAGAYALFFTVWNPGYFVFWVPLLVPFWTLMAVAFASPGVPVARRRATVLATAVGLALLAANNAATGIGPHARAAGNGRLQKALAVRAHARPGDCIVIAGAGDDADAEVYLPYFAGCEVLSLNALLAGSGGKPETLAALRAAINERLAPGRKVYVHEELYTSEGPYATLTPRHGITRAEVVRFLKRHYRVGPPSRWRVSGPGAAESVVVRTTAGGGDR
ncbi:MAG: hypothetical protein HY321_21615 [Armatimonadetes bacterium]|nr:hypothetical protein [Armatimonadota bacterium]